MVSIHDWNINRNWNMLPNFGFLHLWIKGYMRGGRPTTSISSPNHILIIFSSEPHRNPRPFNIIFFCVNMVHVLWYKFLFVKVIHFGGRRDSILNLNNVWHHSRGFEDSNISKSLENFILVMFYALTSPYF